MTVHESLCALCAGISNSCCQHRDIYVTLGDIRRIHALTEKNDFYEFRTPPDASYLCQDDDPTWAKYAFTMEGRHRVLKSNQNGDCTFLTSTGCVLPIDIRPLICRLHPFVYTAEGIDAEPSRDCPVYLIKSGQSVIEAIGMDITSALSWHKLLYTEIIEGELNS